MKTSKRILWGIACTAVAVISTLFITGVLLTSPAQRVIGVPPDWFDAESIQLGSSSGSTLQGWYYAPANAQASIVLLHPVRGNRRSMLGRARFLSNAGYAVLLIDFQAHGESPGSRITFGHLESMDAFAAVSFAKQRESDVPVVVIGRSLGGAAALLSEPALDIDGLILEAVFPDIDIAVENRLEMRLGNAGAALTPVLTSQFSPWLGIDKKQLSPVSRSPDIAVPVFVISGELDRRTTKEDTLALYAQFQSEKELWLVPGAVHEDLHAYAQQEYEARVLAFVRGVTKGSQR